MAIFEELGKKISNAGQDVVGQTKKMAEISRINNEISSLKKEMDTHLIVLGKEFYTASQGKLNHETIDKVTEIRKALKNLNVELVKVKGTQQCKECGEEVQITAHFCSKCGTSIPSLPSASS